MWDFADDGQERQKHGRRGSGVRMGKEMGIEQWVYRTYCDKRMGEGGDLGGWGFLG